MQYRIFALLTALYLLILFLISMAWEFSLVDRVAALWFSGHLPRSIAERWEFVVTGISIAIVAWIVPGALMLRNIMERKRVESTQERLVSILQVTPDPVKISRRDGRTIFLNRAARRIMGISDDRDVSDLHYLDAHTPEARKSVEEVAIPTALAEGTWMGESELLTPSGGRMPVSEVIIAHKDRKGAVEYLSTISRDITAQKEIEILKSDFVSIVSHELRTPLTSIRNSLNLVMDEMGLELPEDAMEMLHIAQANTNRLARLINDILDLEKVEYKRLELFPVQLDARELIATTLSELEPVASQAQVALKHKVDDGIVLEGDRDRLVQVITNLVGN
ncbi:MAG: PAS domain S-box protein, partial [SAR324 cluster bacterium]|nr:PAS domain S-box protein [SAR324 cluster bacterium]